MAAVGFTPSFASVGVAPTTTDPIVQKEIADRKATLPDALKPIFQSIADKIDFAPGGKVDPAKVGETLDALKGALVLMATTVIKDLAELIAKLTIEQNASGRDNALQGRLAARQEAKADLMGQAAKMEEAAVQALIGAAVAFAVTVVASTIAIVGSVGAFKDAGAKISDLKNAVSEVASIKDAIKAAGGMEQVTKNSLQTADAALNKTANGLLSKLETANNNLMIASKQMDQITAKSGIFQQIGQLGQAIANFSSASTQSTAKMTDAEGSRLAALAQDAQAQADVAKALYDALVDMMNKMVQFLKDMQDTEVNMMAAITRA